MFFILSKTVGFFASPSNLLIVAALAGLVLLMTRWRRTGIWLAFTAIMLLAVAGFSPVGNLLMSALEERFPANDPAWDAARGEPVGIVVLGGGIAPEVSAARGTAELTEAGERMTAAVALARQYPRARIVFSGGNGGLTGGAKEAVAAERLFVSLGLPRERFVLEDRSRNTAENAAFTQALVQPKAGERWLLVTSANHMPRSIGCFRKVGFPVEAYPVDWRTRGPQDGAVPFNRLSAGLARTDTAVREWVGLVAYWMTGRSSALLPSP
ncbi:MAG: YdcF family protein [Xanthobacteraceae bacterium]|uniref:YdcF family protein n=1 Tax=Pseudolabrys sp. TaxID=1960880 RepID=UPI003D09857B